MRYEDDQEMSEIAILKKKLRLPQKNSEAEKLLRDPNLIQEYIKTDEILERITQIKTNLSKAIELLDLTCCIDGSTHGPRSFFDFGIMMALYYLYMHIIERIISNAR